MAKDKWTKKHLLGIDPLSNMLRATGTRAYIKGELQLLFSPMEQHPDGLWKHASLSHPTRYPSWEEILSVRYEFFSDNEEVFQVLPPRSEYVNIHKNCFHLWCPVGRRLTPG